MRQRILTSFPDRGGAFVKPNVCRTLFFTLLRISAFTFGGGYVIIPLIRGQFVEKLGWLSEEDMLDVVAMAQSSPGAVAMNAAAQIGYRLGGVRGTFCAVLGTVIPPFVWISVISLCYDAFRTSPAVDAFLRSMQPAVAAVIFSAAISMLKPIRQKKKVSSWLLFFGALALGLSGINVVWILLGGAVFGALTTLMEVKRHAA